VPLRFRVFLAMPQDHPKAATAIGRYDDDKNGRRLRAAWRASRAGTREAARFDALWGSVTAQPQAAFDSPGGLARPIAEIGVPP
jgi:hypothetical protein